MTKRTNKSEFQEPMADYAQPLTFEKVWLMFKETEQQMKETDRQIKETDRILTEKFQETDRQFKESRLQMQETDRALKHATKIVSGLGINIGEQAEEYFKGALENMDEIFGIPYEQVASMEKKNKSFQGQYNIVLYNGDKMVVIEVKNKLHPKDVDDFHTRKLPLFKKLFPEYADKKIIGGLAALTVPKDAAYRAEEMGYLVMSRWGQKIKVLNKKGAGLREV